MIPTLSMAACWPLQNARDILQTEALAGDDALFLATHTPVRGFDIEGSAKDVADATEEGLLQALARADRRHAFCVVQGEPGSGKSHLIRWLAVNWPAGADLPLLIQRANGSLEGALRQLQTRVPTDLQHLFQNLGRRHMAGLVGRGTQFLLNLGAALQPDHFEKPLEHTEWCRRHDPSSLILNKHVREGWGGPLRILKLMDGAGGERNSETASFNIEDILDLSRVCAEVHDSVDSEALARRLIREAAFIREGLAQERTFEQIRADHPDEVRAAVALIDALNVRRNYAVQSVIGVTAEDLKKLFEELRAALQQRGMRVVLLLEDITSWEGLDDSLVDALVTDAQTRPDADLCPVISVVGVTPEYYAKLPGNYKQRITHDVRLGEARGHLQDVAALREQDSRTAFVARYLSAARAGSVELRTWRERFRTERDLAPPNPCERCPRVEACHSVFGAVDQIGLFPFTAEAVDNLFFALKDDDQGMTHRTPRGLVQAVLSPTLLHPKVLDDRAYPGPQIETAALERQVLPNALRARLENRVPAGAERERLRRVLSYWGDQRPALKRGADGELYYAGVSERLVAAFGLPWIADEVVDPPPPMAPPPPLILRPAPPEASATAALADPAPTLSAPPAPWSEPAADLQPRAQPEPLAAAPVAIAPRPPLKPPLRTAAPSARDLDKLRQEIAALREGQTPKNIALWNAAVFDMLGRLDIRKLGVDRWTWSKLFTAETVKIAGTGLVRAQHFVVERADWLLDGLEAWASLRNDDLADEEGEFSRRRLAFALRRLEGLAKAHVARRVPVLPDGERWSPVTTTVQLLLARAWLRRTVSPDAPTHQQWTAILSEESEAEGDPASRTREWVEALNATKNLHAGLRAALHDMVRLPQGGAAGFGVSDAADAAAAMVAVIESCRLSPVPSGGDTTKELEDLRQAASRLEGLVTIPLSERKLLTGRATQFLDLLRGGGVAAHLLRLDKVITDVATPLPTTLPGPFRAWKEALERQRRFLDDPATVQALQDMMFRVTDAADELPSRLSSLLGWLAAAPAADLRTALDLALQGEKLVAELLPHVRDLLAGGGGGTDLSAIHTQGKLLQAAAEKARRGMAGAAA